MWFVDCARKINFQSSRKKKRKETVINSASRYLPTICKYMTYFLKEKRKQQHVYMSLHVFQPFIRVCLLVQCLILISTQYPSRTARERVREKDEREREIGFLSIF